MKTISHGHICTSISKKKTKDTRYRLFRIRVARGSPLQATLQGSFIITPTDDEGLCETAGASFRDYNRVRANPYHSPYTARNC